MRTVSLPERSAVSQIVPPRAASSRLRARCRGPRARRLRARTHGGCDPRRSARARRRPASSPRSTHIVGSQSLRTTVCMPRRACCGDAAARSAACVAAEQRLDASRQLRGVADAHHFAAGRFCTSVSSCFCSGPAARRAPARTGSDERIASASTNRRHRTLGRPGSSEDCIDRPAASPASPRP